MRILTENNQEVTLSDLTNDEVDVPTLTKPSKQEVNEVELNFDDIEGESHDIVTEEEINAENYDEFSAGNLFDDLDEE